MIEVVDRVERGWRERGEDMQQIGKDAAFIHGVPTLTTALYRHPEHNVLNLSARLCAWLSGTTHSQVRCSNTIRYMHTHSSAHTHKYSMCRYNHNVCRSICMKVIVG